MFFRDRIRDDSKYLHDMSSLKGHAKNVILPNDETELREGIRYSSKGNTKVTISGNRTGSSGGAVPNGGDIMSMEYLRGVIGVGKDEKGVFVRVLPCTTISMFNDRIRNSQPEVVTEEIPALGGMVFPVKVDRNSTVGGCISANRSGIRRFVRRIKVVFSDSTFMYIQRGDYKASDRRMAFAAGRNYFSFELPSYDSADDFGPRISSDMDLIDLFIGSEGVFGIITEADIYVSDHEDECPTEESGKLYNDSIRMKYGQQAVDDLVRIKGILDPNYILNIGNLF
ncbi:MAG: FAD-binding oxidoreductase [Thermoplasmata archaeon]|jgi:D-lactate dehydrogenase (cytochrome)|nr:FAD-binding oxidoreductase [Thermoplasmata archaeon]